MLNFLKKRWYFIVIILVVIGVVLYIVFHKTPPATTTSYKVERQNLQDTLSESGQIDADQKATLQFQASGMLNWVGVKEGDTVYKGQAIASLDQRQLAKTFQKYMNSYLTNRWTFDQTVETNNDQMNNGVTQQLRDTAKRLIDEAQFSLNNSVLDVELNQITQQYATIYTPIAGLVTKASPSYAGQNVVFTSAEYDVVDPGTVFFSVSADQTDVVKLINDLSGDISLDAYPNVTIPGKIYFISFTPQTGQTSTAYEVRMRLNTANSDYRYRLGMTGDVNFILRTIENVISVPTTYIKDDNGKKYVLKNIKGSQVKTYVVTGEEVGDNTVISSGLSDGDIIYD